ncbi:sugar transferase [Pseudogemmobacter faecipullorum]|uniref:Sugar transferase n=1 Tax=Pseudogemmobacter faecipullorum TaxID=2755041 RepID=A0ABS8CJS1_9RHOB|nr:sugar transferase [Pseudogemmobacter faecipullorum]MCB5409647.1 sugar transferase [Pseudogemmobacter faecipullorum]
MVTPFGFRTGDIGSICVVSTIKKTVYRISDVGLALLILPIALPAFVVLWLAIRLGSPGPVILRLACIGQDGRVFQGYRFRSVYVDARARVFRADCAGETSLTDLRVTRVGAFMLRTGLNRLPQLLNILRGDMSFRDRALQPLAGIATAAALQAQDAAACLHPLRG